MWRRKAALGLPCGKCGTQRQPALVQEGRIAKRASELGFAISGKDYWLFKDACPECKAELWRRSEALGKLCTHCVQQSLSRPSMEQHPRWVNGRRVRKDGYIEIALAPSDPCFVMCHHKKHTALEHRVVVARSLGRPLKPWEIVHHRNRNRADNRLENLELVAAQHIHQSVGIQDQILQRLSQLEAKISDLSIRLSLQEALQGSSDTGNPELGSAMLPSVETLYTTPHAGEEKVQASTKVEGTCSHNPEHPRPRITAGALAGDRHRITSRSRGNLSHGDSRDIGNPELSTGEELVKCVETMGFASPEEEMVR